MQKRQLSNNAAELYEQVGTNLADCKHTRTSGCGEGKTAVAEAVVESGEAADSDEAEGGEALEDSDESGSYGQGEEVENESGNESGNETGGAGEETSKEEEEHEEEQEEESEWDSDKSVSVHNVANR